MQQGITCHSIVDERSAGFVALGIAQQTHVPVALICTSGSALLNYAPAMVEAYYQHVPLLVISADRPTEWIDQGDGQCMNQKNVFANYCKGFWEYHESEQLNWHNKRVIAEAFHTATQMPFGPVHINIPLSEPLYGMTNATVKSPPPYRLSHNSFSPSQSLVNDIVQQLNTANKVMLIIGQQTPHEQLKQAVHTLSKLPQCAVLTETTANLFGNGFIDQIDRVLATISDKEIELFQPDIVISMGGMVVSKRLKAILRKGENTEHWHISTASKAPDTYQKLNWHIQADPIETLSQVSGQLKSNTQSTFSSNWQQKSSVASELHKQYLDQAPYSDLLVFDKLLSHLPDNTQLQLGNSTVVRYAQLFENNTHVSHYCNRGISGIDGCTSTAIGASMVNEKRTIFISGEIAFLYDNNALWNQAIPNDFLAIVINNGEGNIFKFIEGPDKFEETNKFIATQHSLSVKPLAEMHGFNYLSAKNISELEAAISQGYACTQKTILEVFTPGDVSPQMLRNYFKFLKQS